LPSGERKSFWSPRRIRPFLVCKVVPCCESCADRDAMMPDVQRLMKVPVLYSSINRSDWL